jgi:hypothetical protein
MQPTHRGVPLEILAKSFLFDIPKPTLPPTGGQPMFEAGGGGTSPQMPPQTMTAEQVKTLRETDSKKYRELVKKGVITKALAS